MEPGHEHYQQLAVGHVLGGLEPDDAAAFRSHLSGCRVCRARVAELRGIASELERAERDERARATVQTEVAHQESEDAGPRPRRPAAEAGSRIGVRQVTVAAIVVVLLAGAMAFWNLHLRTNNAVMATVAEQHAQTLEVLAGGVPLDVAADHPVRGLAAMDGEHVAVTLTGLGQPAEGERIVAWVDDGAGLTPVAELQIRSVGDGTVAVVLEDEGAETLELTAERGPVGDEPGGELVASVDLAGS